jgi:hypothetical protein
MDPNNQEQTLNINEVAIKQFLQAHLKIEVKCGYTEYMRGKTVTVSLYLGNEEISSCETHIY